MMYAVITTGGKQYKVQKGDVIRIEKLDAAQGEKVKFDVLMIVDGQNTLVGRPLVGGYEVTGTVQGEGKGKKVIAYNFKPKKNYRRKRGHRQPYTLIEITAVGKVRKPRAPRKKADQPVETAEAPEQAIAEEAAAE